MIRSRFPSSLAVRLAVLLLSTGALAADGGEVSNATFTSGMSDGAPVDYRQEFFLDTSVVYFYGELLGLQGQTMTHRWSLEGRMMQEVPIAVTSGRQSAWSKSVMQPEWTGNWAVDVVDQSGRVLGRSNFAYNPN